MPNKNTPPAVNITWTGNLQPLFAIEVSPDAMMLPTGKDGTLALAPVLGPGICGFSYGSSTGPTTEFAALDKLTTLSVDANWVNGNATGIYINAASLTSLAFPNLQLVAGQTNHGIFITAGGNLATVSLPKLKGVFFMGMFAAGINIAYASITTLDLPELTHLEGLGMVIGINLNSDPALTTINAPKLVTVVAGSNALSVVNTTVNIANLTFGTIGTTKTIIGGFQLTGQKLTQTSVDNLLALLASLDGTNGTTQHAGYVTNISGGTSAAPTFTGQTSTSTSVATGGGVCTFTTSNTSPAYAADDLVTITGATTPGYNGTYKVLASPAPDAAHFTVANATTGTLGTATIKRTKTTTESYYNWQKVSLRASTTITTN